MARVKRAVNAQKKRRVTLERAAERDAAAEQEQRELRELRERHAAEPREERVRRPAENLDEV